MVRGQSSSRQNVRHGPRCGPVYVSVVVQCGQVEVLAATNPSVNSCQPMDQPSWPPMQPPHQSSKGPSQEGQSEKLVQNRGLQNPCQPQTPREYPGYKIHPGVELATLRSSPDNQDHSAQDSSPFPEKYVLVGGHLNLHYTYISQVDQTRMQDSRFRSTTKKKK